MPERGLPPLLFEANSIELFEFAVGSLKSRLTAYGYSQTYARRLAQRGLSKMPFRDGLRRSPTPFQFCDAQNDVSLPALQPDLGLHALAANGRAIPARASAHGSGAGDRLAVRWKASAYFFDGQGAPQGAQAPAKSSRETARPVDGLIRCCMTTAASPSTTTAM